MKLTPASHGVSPAKARSATTAALIAISFAGNATAQTVINGGFEFNPISPESSGGALFQAERIAGWQIANDGDLFLAAQLSKEVGFGSSGITSVGSLEEGKLEKEDDSKFSNQYATNLLSTVGSSLDNSILTQSISGFRSKADYSLNYFIADYFGGDKYAALLNVSIYGSSGALLSSFDDSIDSEVGFADKSFTGDESAVWKPRSLTFIPDGESVVIAFDFGPKSYGEYPELKLKNGSKEGGPYFYTAGLDGVSITTVTIPEPSSTLLLVAFGSLAAVRRRRAPLEH